MAAPIISEEGRGLRRKKKKKPRVSEPGVLVIEHAEASDAGQTVNSEKHQEFFCYSYFLFQTFHFAFLLLKINAALTLSLRCVHLRGMEHGGGRHQERLRVGGLGGLVVRWGEPVGRGSQQRAAVAGKPVQCRGLSGGSGQGADSIFTCLQLTVSDPDVQVLTAVSCFLCRWFTLSRWCWSGSCSPAEGLPPWVRTSRTPPSLCHAGSAPLFILITLRSATPPR